ncbi:DUF4837 family protein [Porifericola rhodea]|uniref:DUF4837 family protein n=1 Tax=Porifericola rhodea TaxID=930972 RepID=UPI0026664E27|nr:DUF4837 family protein [Porifericola rhodea]WKN32279.1 DUF4837 family protein [Porifericola rhodea]
MNIEKLSLYIPSILIIGLIGLFGACSEGGSSSTDTLPTARGAAGEVVLVMDSALWHGDLGDELRQTFLKAMPGLPQPEPYFSVRYVDPFKLNKVLKNAKNMLFVATLDNESMAGKKMKSYFTQSSVSRIEEDPNLFQFSKKNQFAKGQEVLFLFGTSEDALIDNLKNNREEVRNHFHEVEINRLRQNLYKANERKTVNRYLLEEYEFYLKVPYGYEQVPRKDADNFVWIRNLGDEVDKSIIVAYKDYTSEEAFKPESIMEFREQIAKQYLADDSTTHMTVQSLAPIEHDTVNFNGKYAIETRGLWKLTNNSMGGPFLSYTFVDEDSGRLYYIEGFVYSPSKQKRPFIREIEAILNTFKTASEINQKQATS